MSTDQIEFNSTANTTKLDCLSKQEIIKQYTIVESELARVVRENYELRNQRISDDQLRLILAEQLEGLTNTIYGRKSERYRKPIRNGDDDSSDKTSKSRIKKLSERYPNIFV